MRLPTELICEIIADVVSTPAVFIFDAEVGENPHPPLMEQSSHIRFRPHVRGESLVSKTIRSLLLTSKWVRSECLEYLQGINVPIVSQHAVVRFNPDVHVICLDKVTDACNQTRGIIEAESWVKDASHILTELNFNIKHLAFTGFGHFDLCTFMWFQTVFPTIEHVYGAFEMRSLGPLAPIGVAFPTGNQAQMFNKATLYMVKKHCEIVRRRFLTSNRRPWRDRQDPPMVPQFEEMILI